MAYLMADAAAGSDAALRMQQNMAAAPDVQQTQANFMQEQALKLQHQAQANESLRLKNLVEGTEVQIDSDIRKQVADLIKTPEYQQASDDPGRQTEMLASVYMKHGKVSEGSTLLSHAAAADAKKVVADLKKAEVQSRQIRNISDALKDVPEEGLDQYFRSMPEEMTKNLVKMAGGQENWNRMGPSQKKAFVARVSESGQEHIERVKQEGLERRAKLIRESMERIAENHDNTKIALKHGAGGKGGGSSSKSDAQEIRRITKEVDTQKKMFLKELSVVEKDLEQAKTEQAEAVKARDAAGGIRKLFSSSYDDRVSAANDSVKLLHQKHQEVSKKFFDRLKRAEEKLPAGPAKEAFKKDIEKLSAFFEEEPEPKNSSDSNKIKSAVEAGGQKYEPDKYDYRITPDGKVQRKPK